MTGFGTVTLVTDLGRVDESVGVMHSILNDFDVIDLSHEVPAYDSAVASILLVRASEYLVPGVVIGLADAAVARRHIVVPVGDGESILIGPDNGVLAPIIAVCGGASNAVTFDSVSEPLHVAYAKTAARLCSGATADEIGAPTDVATLLPASWPLPEVSDDRLECQALYIDHYGRVDLNIDSQSLLGWPERSRVNSLLVRRVAGEVELNEAELGLVIGAEGLARIVSPRAPASERLNLERGDKVLFERI